MVHEKKIEMVEQRKGEMVSEPGNTGKDVGGQAVDQKQNATENVQQQELNQPVKQPVVMRKTQGEAGKQEVGYQLQPKVEADKVVYTEAGKRENEIRKRRTEDERIDAYRQRVLEENRRLKQEREERRKEREKEQEIQRQKDEEVRRWVGDPEGWRKHQRETEKLGE